MYQLLKPLLLRLPAEAAHTISLNALSALHAIGASRWLSAQPTSTAPIRVMGIDFPNAIGLAAGLDKNACHIDGLASLGFGFIEVGTVTPLAQTGNPKPRLFRLPEHEAIINRMGFNNRGVAALISQVQKRKSQCPIGINIGKNRNTPIENAWQDYAMAYERAYPFADYITVNLSSPNTPSLRDLQHTAQLAELLRRFKSAKARCQDLTGKNVATVVKIAPDLDTQNLADIAEVLVETEIDGVIATNTTVDKTAVSNHRLANEAGGLSGKPLTDASTKIVKTLAEALDKEIPIIAVGGIMNPQDALAKLDAGADLIQLYSGLIYRGPSLITDCLNAIAQRTESA